MQLNGSLLGKFCQTITKEEGHLFFKISKTINSITMNDFSAESPQNYEQKSVCCFVVDVSYSMSGAPISALNQGLVDFHHEITNDSTCANRLEIAIVEFSSNVDVLQQPALVENFTMPLLQTKGSTALVDGVRAGLQLVDTRKSWYKSTGQPYLRPWVILITDGAPDGGQDVNGLSQEIRKGVQDKKFVFLAIGVDGADMSVLNQISSPDMPPAQLQGLKFADFFKWVSASMSVVAGSKDGDKINLPNPGAWMTGFKI